MIEWARAERDGRCGSCARPIALGQAIQVTSIVRVSRKFIRCEECAGPAPDLPAIIAPVSLPAIEPAKTSGFVSLREAGNGWMPYRDSE